MDAEEEATKAALVDMLLNSEADPNRINDDGDTALHFICEQVTSPVQSLIVTRLLAAGADPSKVLSHSSNNAPRLFFKFMSFFVALGE